MNELTKNIDVRVMWLLGINAVLFVLATLFQSISSDADIITRDFYSLMGVFNTVLVSEGQLWLLITSNFVHFDLIHFLFNMYALVVLGRYVVQFYGSKQTFIIYMFGGLVASLFTYFGSLIGDEISALGASGSVYAMLGILVAGSVKKDSFGNSELPIDPRGFYPTLALAVLISLMPQVGLLAHLGGFVAGIGFSYVFVPLGKVMTVESHKRVDLLYTSSLLVLGIASAAFFLNLVRIIFIA